jgi:putative ABC transport system substrate-binding protein
VWVLSSPATFLNRPRIVGYMTQHRLPTMCALREYALSGGLLSYGPSYADHFRRATSLVDRIVKGTKPADLPIEQPTKFELVINLKTAKTLGLTIPPSLLQRADQVIDRVADLRQAIEDRPGDLSPPAAPRRRAARREGRSPRCR